MSARVGIVLLCLLTASACTREQADRSANVRSGAMAVGGARTAGHAPSTMVHRAGGLPDRGEFLAYPGHVQRADGAYTWFRADLSEAHALRAIADGQLRLTTPEGRLLDVRFDRHVEHPSGDWTWIGHLPGEESAETIITFGERAVYGSIAQPGGKPPLKLTMRDGLSWLVETDPRKAAAIINAVTRPKRPDYHIVRRADLPAARNGIRPVAGPIAAGAPVATTSTATATAANTVDLLVGYTGGFVSAQGSTSAAMTRINYLVDVANAALANAQVPAQVRLVHAMQVTYTDLNTNDTALEELSGYKSGVGAVTPNSAFNALRAARETYGADLVSLVRPFKDPEQDSCGLAWLLGGAKQGIQAGAGWDDLAYSVIGDGEDVGSDGHTYFCRDETLAHEMGHNEGSAHDRQTAAGDDGTLDDPDDYGAFQYSFGYKTTSTTGNFYTVMAYGDTGQTPYRVFSNPRITFCGGRACGTTTYEDNARSLTQTMPVVAGFRPTEVPMAANAHNDIDGDGTSDLIFRNASAQLVGWWRMTGAHVASTASQAAGGSYSLSATGDFNGDGRTDLAWTNANRQLVIFLSTGNAFSSTLISNDFGSGWQLVGAGDIDGDSKADLIFRNSTLQLVGWWNMNGTQVLSTHSQAAGNTYAISAIGDFNGDGRTDLAWTNAARRLVMFASTGSGFSSTVVSNDFGAGWAVVNAGDIDGDGRSDLIFRNAGAQLVGWWNMDGSRVLATHSQVAGGNYSLATTGDFNGDGRIDLAWTNADRRIVLFLSSGAAFTSAVLTNDSGAGWSLQR